MNNLILFETAARNDIVTIERITDGQSGEVYATLTDFMDHALEQENQSYFIPELERVYIYILKELLRRGYKNTKENKLKRGEFNIRTRENIITKFYILAGNKPIAIIDYKMKFNSEYDGDRSAFDYAVAKGLDKHSLASDAFELMLRSCYGRSEARFQLFRNDYPVLDEATNDMLDNLKQQFCKGYQFCDKGDYKTLYELDQFSAYSAQLALRQPQGHAFIFDNLDEVPENYYRIVEFTYANLKPRANYIDFLAFDIGLYNVYGTMTVPEAYYNLILEHYHLSHKVLKVYAFKTAPSRFKPLIRRLCIDGRKQTKKAIEKYNKSLSNALIGKMGQRTVLEQTYIENNELIKTEVKQEAIYLPIHIAAVMGQKCILIRLHQKHRDKIRYSNTDSLLSNNAAIVKALNKDLPKIMADLGHFRIKRKIVDAGLKGVNQYYALTEDGSVTTCISGVKFEKIPTKAELDSGQLDRIRYIADYTSYTTKIIKEQIEL